MRFLMVTTFFPPYNFGGDGVYVQRLSHELARRGHEVHVVHCTDAFHVKQKQRPVEPVASPPGVTVHSLASGFGLLSPLSTQQSGRAFFKTRPVKELFKRYEFDVVHYHNMSLMGLDMLRIGTGVKLYTLHEHWVVCPTHVLYRFNRELCTKQTCLSCQLVARRPPQLWRYSSLLDRCMAEVDRFLCPSQFTLDKHRELGFSSDMSVLPYFIPRDDNGTHTTLTSPHPRPYALFVGRLEKIKGVQDLIRVFRTYRGCDLVIIGDGTYEQELRQMGEGLPHVVFLGRLPYHELRAWYRHALAVIAPSICYEVFAIIILEAFAEGTPALVTPIGAMPEVVTASEGGGIVYRSDEELVNELERLKNVPGRRKQMGERGRDAYLRLWSENPHIDRYMSIIGELGA